MAAGWESVEAVARAGRLKVLSERLCLSQEPGVGGGPALPLQHRAHRLPHLGVVVVQPADLWHGTDGHRSDKLLEN